jgi:DHA1 family multidrug resistance protein-like MFS transporter
MLRLIRNNIIGLRNPLYAASALAFSGLGDAFLYAFLPQFSGSMNIPVVWVGFLLSVNRFIRIVFNGYVVNVFARYGVRNATIAATLMAIGSTIGYGLGLGLLSLTIFRILWGMAYAILRVGALAYALNHKRIGISLGSSRSIQELGPMFSLWIGPILLIYFSGEQMFFCLALLSIPALLYALQLPELSYKTGAGRTIEFRFPTAFNALTFLVSFTVEGVLIVVIGVLLTKNNIQLTSLMITSMAAGYLVYRRICFIVLSPVSGVIADRINFTKIFNFSILMIIVGFVLLIIGFEMAGLILIFTFNSINSTMAPGGASNNKTDKINAVAVNANWRDIGAATGTLAGGMLLAGNILTEVFIITTFILSAALSLNYRKQN